MEKTLIIKKAKAPATRVIKAVNLQPCDYKVIPGQDGKEDVYQRLLVYVNPQYAQVSVPCTGAVFNAVEKRRLHMLVDHHFYIHFNAQNEVCRVEPVKVKNYTYNMMPEEEANVKNVEILVEESGFTSVKNFPAKMDAAEVDRIKRAVDAATEIYEDDRIADTYLVISYTKGTDGVTISISPKAES